MVYGAVPIKVTELDGLTKQVFDQKLDFAKTVSNECINLMQSLF